MCNGSSLKKPAGIVRKGDDNIMSMITSERIEQTVGVVGAAARRATHASIGDLVERGVLTGDNFQRILTQGDKVADKVTAVVQIAITELLAELAENVVGRLKLISGGKKVVFKSTTGKRTIVRANSAFKAGIDGNFVKWGLDVAGPATEGCQGLVYEMSKDGTFAQVYGGFGENLDRLCMTQEQIIDFCVDYPSELRSEGCSTFFLFKVGAEFFVAIVSVYAGGLRVYVNRLSYGLVWLADFRDCFVIPQMKTSVA